jgi:hypothetical protein
MRGRRRRGFAGPVMGMLGCRLLSSTHKDPGMDLVNNLQRFGAADAR